MTNRKFEIIMQLIYSVRRLKKAKRAYEILGIRWMRIPVCRALTHSFALRWRLRNRYSQRPNTSVCDWPRYKRGTVNNKQQTWKYNNTQNGPMEFRICIFMWYRPFRVTVTDRMQCAVHHTDDVVQCVHISTQTTNHSAIAKIRCAHSWCKRNLKIKL